MDIDFPHGRKLRLMVGDITTIRVDAIVNAANSALRAGGGVDGAIHRAGGPTLQQELDQIRATSGMCRPGSAVVTGAGALPAKHVFHAVGPIYKNGGQGEPEQLANCYRTCQDLAEQHGARTVSFPAISTGAYGYPLEEAAAIALDTIAARLKDTKCEVKEVLLVLFDQGTYAVHAKIAADRITSSKSAESLS